ncbi:ABC transporter ATP-binding protein [Cohnella terricola]|uniref:ABC transporter ATP-binding protein n=1 Tax=Cohnella terricola TaxID=1289167 RepID=A0A559JGT6_9BACL|nr:dipeptide/oligopeptide/nickel ABC transporter ATP-binding protein [Cohnella terricola]TVX99092.1 ABC transporter ATP-binding protein [Cohnella terricola]
MSLLVADNISKTYGSAGWFRKSTSEGTGVRNLSFSLEEGTCLGILGESGAGKSTLGRIVLGLLPPDSGTITFEGIDLYRSDRKARKQWRRDIQVVFQDSYSAVNPRMRILDIIAEPLRNYERLTSLEERRKVAELLVLVGLTADDMHKRPGQMSGGQLQRVNIARAIALKPKLIVLDEPVSSLDMIIQKQILIHLRELKEKYGISYLFISHDIMAVHYLADRIAYIDQGSITDVRTTLELSNTASLKQP